MRTTADTLFDGVDDGHRRLTLLEKESALDGLTGIYNRRHADRVAMTVSIGVATLGRGTGARDLLRHADKALYQAKRDGRNQVVVYEDPVSDPEDSSS